MMIQRFVLVFVPSAEDISLCSEMVIKMRSLIDVFKCVDQSQPG